MDLKLINLQPVLQDSSPRPDSSWSPVYFLWSQGTMSRTPPWAQTQPMGLGVTRLVDQHETREREGYMQLKALINRQL